MTIGPSAASIVMPAARAASSETLIAARNSAANVPADAAIDASAFVIDASIARAMVFITIRPFIARTTAAKTGMIA